MRNTIKAVAVVLTLAVLAAGQQSETKKSDPADQDAPLVLKSDLVSVAASVTDRNGRPIKSLASADFTIFEDGLRQKIAHFSASEEPFSLMLIIDVSGSTIADIDLMKRAARNFIAELRNDDKVAVIVFSGDVELVAGFKDTRERVMSELDSIATPAATSSAHRFNPNTGTSYYDALFLAVDQSPLKNAEGRKAIVCLTDAVDSTSKMPFAETAKMVEKSDASVYILRLDTEEATLTGLLKDYNDRGYLGFSQSQIDRYYDMYDKDSIERHKDRRFISPLTRRRINAGLYEIARREASDICERTGGRVYPVAKLSDLSNVYKQVADDLRSQYLIGYYSSNETHDGKWRKIRVQVRSRDANLRAREGYWAPSR